MWRAVVIGAMLSAFVVMPPTSAQQSTYGRLSNFQYPGISDNQQGIVDRGTLSGVVITSDGNRLAEAHITVRDVASGRIAATGDSDGGGEFSVSNLPKGSYEIVATWGVYEVRQEVWFDGHSDNSLTLRMPHIRVATGAGRTVSVAQMRVPKQAINELKRAREALRTQKLNEAEKHIATAILIAPKYSDALTLRAILEIQRGDLKAASDDLTSAIECDNNNSLAYIEMAAVFSSQNCFEDADREAQRGIALSPDFWQGYYELGRAQLGKGEFENALRSATRAEELATRQYGFIYVIKGYAFFGLRNFKRAISEFEKYLTREKDGPVAAEVRRQVEVAKSLDVSVTPP